MPHKKAFVLKFNGDVQASQVSTLLTPIPLNPDPCDLSTKKWSCSSAAVSCVGQVKNLRQEVTAVIRNANKDDEVVLILNTGGGTVTGCDLNCSNPTHTSPPCRPAPPSVPLLKPLPSPPSSAAL